MIHHVFACKTNVGDWLSALGIQSLLGQQVVEHFCDDPFVPKTIRSLENLTERDLVVVGGGGLFMSYFAPFWEGLARIAGRVPYCIWGVGYCDLKREMSRTDDRLLEHIVRGADLCSVRDELTRSYLSACDLPEPVACPSMSVLSTPAASRTGLLHVNHYDLVGDVADAAIRKITKTFAQETGRQYFETNNLIESGDKRGMAHVLSLYERSDVVVTSRLHGCILGLAMGCKVLAVSGDRKIDSFMAAAGLEDWLCEPGDQDFLAKGLARLAGQVPPVAFLEKTRTDNQSIARNILNIARAAESRSPLAQDQAVGRG